MTFLTGQEKTYPEIARSNKKAQLVNVRVRLHVGGNKPKQ